MDKFSFFLLLNPLFFSSFLPFKNLFSSFHFSDGISVKNNKKTVEDRRPLEAMPSMNDLSEPHIPLVSEPANDVHSDYDGKASNSSSGSNLNQLRDTLEENCFTKQTLSSSSVEDDNQKCKMMTGITWPVFIQLFIFLSAFVTGDTRQKSLPLREQFFLTLIKLRHNTSFDFLAHLRGIPKTTCIDIFWKWLDLMHAKLNFMVKWQDRENIFQTIPPVFKKHFPRLTSIIDCFEIFIDYPKKFLPRSQCYSQYKKHCTIKVFISCNPLGAVNFLSKCWGGRASDVKIVRESGFIDSKYHMPGDQILADRGFTLDEDFATICSAQLLTPAFTKGKKQLCAADVEASRKLSSVRNHIERVIGLMKNRYTILKGTMPIRCVQRFKDEALGSHLASCDKIVIVCAALTNMGESIVFKDQ